MSASLCCSAATRRSSRFFSACSSTHSVSSSIALRGGGNAGTHARVLGPCADSLDALTPDAQERKKQAQLRAR